MIFFSVSFPCTRLRFSQDSSGFHVNAKCNNVLLSKDVVFIAIWYVIGLFSIFLTIYALLWLFVNPSKCQFIVILILLLLLYVYIKLYMRNLSLTFFSRIRYIYAEWVELAFQPVWSFNKFRPSCSQKNSCVHSKYRLFSKGVEKSTNDRIFLYKRS